jgi:hypothetical protein
MTPSPQCCVTTKGYRPKRQPGSQGVRGSNPFSSTERERRNLSNSWGSAACGEFSRSEPAPIGRLSGIECVCEPLYCVALHVRQDS